MYIFIDFMTFFCIFGIFHEYLFVSLNVVTKMGDTRGSWICSQSKNKKNVIFKANNESIIRIKENLRKYLIMSKYA